MDAGIAHQMPTAALAIGDTIDLVRVAGGTRLQRLTTFNGDFDTGTTLQFKLVSDSVAALNSSPTTHIDTGALSFATVAVANKVLLVAPLPFGQYERYLGLTATVASGPFTAGSVRAFLTRDPQFWTALGSNNPSAH